MRTPLCLLLPLLACVPQLSGDDDAADDDGTVDDDSTGDDDTVSDDDSVGDDDVSPCGPEDMDFSAWAATSDGVPSQIFAFGDGVELIAQLGNICPVDLSFTTNSGCLFDSWSLSSPSSSEGMGCDTVISSWSIAAGETLRQSWEIRPDTEGTWVWSVGTSVTGAAATVTFVVSEPLPPG